MAIGKSSQMGLQAQDVSVTLGQTAILKGVDLDIAPVSYTHLTLPTTPYV